MLHIPLLTFTLAAVTIWCPAIADERLVGVWEAGDNAHRAIYGHLKFSQNDVQFSRKGKRWECRTPYKVEASGTDETYSEEVRPFEEGVRSWSWVKVRLGNSKCTSSSHFVFAFLQQQHEYAGFVELRNTSQWAGTGHFHRVGGAK